MPININDLIENLAAAAPTIRGAQNQVTGWLYAEVGGTAANGWNIGSAFRDANSSVVSGTSIYIYSGSDTTDGEWQNASNWTEVSGGGSGGIPEAPTDGQKYARQNSGWSTVTDGTNGNPGDDGQGWTGGSYNAGTGIVTFTSDDGLGFVTGDLRGDDGSPGTPGTPGTNGTNGLGWTGGSYNAATGEVTFTSTDGLGFVTSDLRGDDGDTGGQGLTGDTGDGFTGGSYNSSTGIVTFTSDDSLGFQTTDLRGADGNSVELKGSVDEIADLPAGATQGDLYIVLVDSTNGGASAGDGFVSDGSNNWTNVGPIQGPAGDSASITLGTVTTGAAGSSAVINNSGNTQDAVYNFTIPRGDKGDTGDAGNTGTAATVAVGSTTTGSAGTNATVSNSGSTSAAVFEFTIPKGDTGDTGDTGDAGDAATVAVGTTTTGTAGTNATVTNSGSTSAAVFEFTIPRGDTGDAGDAGDAATIAVGTTTDLAAGASATVTNSGTTSAAVFDFGIPAGAKGDTGDPGPVVDLGGLTNVNTGGLLNGDFLVYDTSGSEWVNTPVNGAKAVQFGLTGNTGEVITWDGTTWNPGQLAYSDLTGLPVLGTVATTNAYSDLTGLPTLGTVATSNNYPDLSQLPSFVQGTNVTIATATNGAGGTEYTISSSGSSGSTTLAGLTDVTIASPSNGEVLTYNSSTSEWNSGTVPYPVTGVNNVGIPTGNGLLTLLGGVIQYQGPDLSGYPLTSSLGNSSTLDVGTTAGTVAAGDDSRLSNARTPTAHTHVIADLTDAGDVVGLDIGTTVGTVAAGDDSRLSDARTPTSHTHVIADLTDAGNVVGLDIGTTAGTVAAGDDARLSNARTPTAHTHVIADLTDAGNVVGLDIGTTTGTVAAGDDARLSNARTPTAHTHVIADLTDAGDVVGLNVGTTTGTVAAGDDSRLSNARTPTAHTHVIADLTDAGNVVGLDIGNAAGTVAAGDDSRLSDARTPTAHTHTHDDITDFDTEVNTLASARIGASSIGNLNNVSSTAPSTGEVLKWDGSDWAPAADNSGSGGGDATVAGGLSQFDDTAISSPTNGQVLQYNNATSDWENINLPFSSIDITGSSITNLPGISAGLVTVGALNTILVGSGTDYVPGYAADEHASMTFNGDPADGDYYMVLAMPCAAVIQSVTAKTVGSSATINYQVMKGTLGGTETAVHAVTGATNTKADVASITSSALAEGDEMWVALDTSANMGQFSITVNYRPSPRFTS